MTATADRRVVHLLNSTATGGAELVVLRLATRLQDLGWTAEVVTLRGEGPVSEPLRAAGIPVSDLGVPPRGGVLALRGALRRALRGRLPEVLHTHNVSPLVAAALALPRRARVRLVHTKHGRARSGSRAGRWLTRWAAHRADAIVAVSRDALDRAVRLEGYPAGRTTLVHNGIDAEAIAARSGPWGTRVVTVARLEPVKALDVLIRAVAHARAAGIAISLTVVGDGSERAALEHLRDELGLRAHVAFAGWTDDVQQHLRHADLFAMSSKSEGHSLTLLEAMAAGLPVVATAVGGNPEVVEHGVTGLLVPRGDPVALGDAICEILADPERAARMGEAGHQRVADRFSLDAMAAAYDAVYRGA